MLKYIKLKDLGNFKFKNILLVIDENEFRRLSQDDICKIFNHKLLTNIYWIFILGNNAANLEDEIDFLIEKTSLKFDDENLLDIVTTSYKFDNIDEFLSDLMNCLKNKNIEFNCLVSKKLKNIMRNSQNSLLGTKNEI